MGWEAGQEAQRGAGKRDEVVSGVGPRVGVQQEGAGEHGEGRGSGWG